MKKLLAVVVAVMMLFGLTVTASAETYTYGSASKAVEVSGDGITITDTDKKLTLPEADELITENKSQSELAIVLNGKDITAPSTPVTLSFTARGTSASQKLFVCHFINGAWKVEGSGAGPTITVTVNDVSPFALVVYTPAGTAGGGTSPKTGETNTVAVVLAAVLAAGALAFVLAPKKGRA